MTTLNARDVRRLRSSLAMLTSDSDGEKLAAVGAVQRLLDKVGIALPDLVDGLASRHEDPKARRRAMHTGTAGPPVSASLVAKHQRTARVLRCSQCDWTEFERSVLNTLSEQRTISEKQQAILVQCEKKARRYRERQAA